MQDFGTADIARLANIPVRSIRAMVRARYVSPVRGPRGALRFSFQDLVVLRTARGLLAARISPRRIGDALRSLQGQLPATAPARGFSVSAIGDRVVVHEAGESRDAHSGQLLLAFDVSVEQGRIAMIDTTAAFEHPALGEGADCERDFEAALDLEETDVGAAVKAYAACVAIHSHTGARTNLGRLLHLQGRISEAVDVYRAVEDPDADLLYNLAVALEDLGQPKAAIVAYERTLRLDDTFADAHHNIARLWQEAGDEKRALRHWSAYRRLSTAIQSPTTK